MMKSLIRALLVTLVFVGVFPFCAIAQEKSLLYYDSHGNEILPDAKVAFRNGKYDRAALLCEWHSAIVGDGRENSLHEKSKRCAKLTKDMKDLLEAGNMTEAKQKARAILSLNPDDADAKATLSIEEAIPPVQDTIREAPPIKKIETTVEEEKPIVEEKNEEIAEIVQPPIEEQHQIEQKIEPETTPTVATKKSYEPHTRFVIKAGASILDLKQLSHTIAPGGAVGVYDVGGSRFGAEIGGYFCPGISGSSALLVGMDAGLVFRATKGIYPELGVGVFSCNSTESTQGLCAGASLNFLFGKHLCFEIGAKYYPEVKVRSEGSVSTLGVSYDFLTPIMVISGGIVPTIRIGWAF